MVSFFRSGTCKGPKRGFGGSDFDDFADLGMSQGRNLNPELPRLRAHEQGTPRAAKHRIQHLCVPKT